MSTSMNLIALALLLFPGTVISTSWPEICTHHPFIKTPGSGVASSYDPNNITEADKAPTCTLTFLYDYPQELGTKFCQARFYDTLIEVTFGSGTITCKYEHYIHCEANEMAILGKCYAMGTQAADLETARQNCQANNGELAKAQDATAIEWILKIHDYNSEPIMVPDVWVDGSLDEMDSQLVENAPALPPTEASIFCFRLNLGVCRFASYQAAAKTTKHHYFCAQPEKRYPAAFRKYCETVRDVFRLPAQYYRLTCYIQSTSVHRPKIVNGLLDVSDYHKDCGFVNGMNTYAVSPLSRTRYEGIKAAVLAHNPSRDAKKVPPILLPGRSRKPDEMRRTNCNEDNWLYYTNSFEYVHPEVNESTSKKELKTYDVSTSGWDMKALKKFCADESTDAIVLAPWSGELYRFPAPTPDDQLFRAWNYPRFFRGHTVCAAGWSKRDIYKQKCKQDWKPFARDDGKMVCYKAINDREIYGETFENTKKACEKIGGDLLAPVESAKEQKLVYDLMVKKYADDNYYEYGRKMPKGSLWFGMERHNTELRWHMNHDGSEPYYSKWSMDEPKFKLGGIIMRCSSLYFENGGTWFACNCGQNKTPNSWRSTPGNVCGYWAK